MKTEIAMRHAVESIWGYVRENQNSLNSEVACRMIQGMVEKAVESAKAERDSFRAELKESRKTIRQLRTELHVLVNEGFEPIGTVASRNSCDTNGLMAADDRKGGKPSGPEDSA